MTDQATADAEQLRSIAEGPVEIDVCPTLMPNCGPGTPPKRP